MHKRSLIFASAMGAVACCAAVANATLYYSPVVQVEGGTTSAATPITIALYNAGLPGQVTPFTSQTYNSSATGVRLTGAPASTSEGLLTNNPGMSNAAAAGTLYSGPQTLYSAGYDATAGTAAVAGASVPRSFGAAVLVGAGPGATVLQTHTNTDAYNTSNIRSATGSDDTTLRYTGGTGTPASSGGWRNFASTPNSTLLSGAITNVRAVELLGASPTLFGTTGAGTRGLYTIDTTGGGGATLLFTTGGTSSPYEFALFDDPTNSASTTSTFGFDTAYIADDSSQASGGGVQKYTFNGTAWSLAYTLKDTGLGTVSYRGLAGQYDTATGFFTLFASTSDGSKLQQITDQGTLASSTYLTLATAGTGTLFRGVALASIPEASAFLFGAVALCGLGFGKFGRKLWA